MYIILIHDGEPPYTEGDNPNLLWAYDTLDEAYAVADRFTVDHTIYRLVDVELDCGDPSTCAEPNCESFREPVAPRAERLFRSGICNE